MPTPKVIKKYHIFKRNPTTCCCNPNSYRLFEDLDTTPKQTRVTQRLKYGNKFRSISVGYCKTGSQEHDLLKKYGYTIVKPECSVFKTFPPHY